MSNIDKFHVSDAKNRPDKDSYYLQIALDVASRSTCLRRKYGAVIVNDELNTIVSTGYNGAPRGEDNCCDLGYCEREDKNVPSGERYEICKAVHAEQNAIISAGYFKAHKCTLYIAGVNVSDNSLADPAPCKLCRRYIANVGIKRVVGLRDGEPVELIFNLDNHLLNHNQKGAINSGE